MLRYPAIISIESFTFPNFKLVDDILYWLVQRYDPSIAIHVHVHVHVHVHSSIDTERDRVQFISGIVNDFYDSSNCRLDAKRLYASDGRAVRELLKVANLLVHAVRVERNHRLGNDGNDGNDDDTKQCKEKEGTSVSVSKDNKCENENENENAEICMDDVKLLRSLTTQITERGARLHSLLAREAKAQKAREDVSLFLEAATATATSSSIGEGAGTGTGTGEDNNMYTQHETRTIQDTLQRQVQEVQRTMESMEQEFSNMEADKNDILAEIKNKKSELDRNNLRLESLEHARPAFMGEFEQFEIELQKHYELYMERYRNIHYLKHELEEVERAEQDRAEELKRNMKRLQAKIRDEELQVFRGYNDKNNSRGGKSTRSAVGSSSDSKHNSTGSANASLQSPSQPITDDESEEASEIVLEDDDSSTDSDPLGIGIGIGIGIDSRPTTTGSNRNLQKSNVGNGNMEKSSPKASSSTHSLGGSVDSATYFLGSDEISEGGSSNSSSSSSGTDSKIGSIESDDNF